MSEREYTGFIEDKRVGSVEEFSMYFGCCNLCAWTGRDRDNPEAAASDTRTHLIDLHGVEDGEITQ